MLLARISRCDKGETLVELIIAITILAIAVVAVGSGIALSIVATNEHREQGVADDFLHNYAETLQPLYAPCTGSTLPNYVTIASLATPPGFNPPTAKVTFWDSSTASFSGTACPGADPGLQQVTLNLTSVDNHANESLVVVLRAST